MQRFRWVPVLMAFGLAGALVGVVPSAASAAPARSRCRPTAFVTNREGGSVSRIDVKTKTKNPDDRHVGRQPSGVAFTPNGRTAFVANAGNDTVSTIDVKTRTKDPHDIPVGGYPAAVVITPNGKTVFVTNATGGTVSTIDVKTKTKNPEDI